MAMVTDEKERARLRHVDLHTHQAVRVPGEVVEGDTLTKVHGLIIERLPVPATS